MKEFGEICWYYYWGWPKPVADIYKKALLALDGNKWPLHFGPSHVVWEDENFGSASWCIEDFNDYRGDYSQAQLDVVLQSLKELVDLPRHAWDVEPKDYDGEHPENFPPTVEMVFV